MPGPGDECARALCAPDASVAEPGLIGTWLLERTRVVHVATGDIRPDPVRGPNPRGILTFDRHGFAAVQVASSGRTVDQVETALRSTSGETGMRRALGYAAYYGRYRIDRETGTISIHVIDGIFPGLAGGVELRNYRLSGDELTLSAVPPGVESGPIRVDLVWRRQR